MEETTDKLYTGAQMVMEAFLREGVDTIFGVPGGANLPLYDVLENGGVGIRPVPEGVEQKRYPIQPLPREARAGAAARRRRLRAGHRARRASATARPARARRTW